MSSWMISEIVRAGGIDTTHPDVDARCGHYRASYRGYYLWFIQNSNKLNAAWANDFDRWANSRVYEGDAPTTLEALDELLDGLDAMKKAFEEKDVMGVVICNTPRTLDAVVAFTERVRLTGEVD